MWTILFDIDGTLIRTQNAGMSAMGQAVTQHYGLTEIPHIRVHGCTDRGIVNELFTELNLSLDADRTEFMATYCEFLETKLANDGGEVLPGVMKLLDALQDRDDVALGIVTGNARQPANIKLVHFGLDHYFDFGGYGDDFADRNDVAAVAATEAQRTLGDAFDTSQVWVVGDTVNDIRCARSIGAKVVAVETGGDNRTVLENASPEFLLADLSDVSGLINTLASNNI